MAEARGDEPAVLLPEGQVLVGPGGEDCSELIPREWVGRPLLVVDLDTCAEVQSSPELQRIGVNPIPVLGLHMRRPVLSPADMAAGLRRRDKSFAILGCSREELTAKRKEIAKAKMDALKKGTP